MNATGNLLEKRNVSTLKFFNLNMDSNFKNFTGVFCVNIP